MVTIGNDWDILLKEEFTKPYYQKLRLFLAQEYRSQTIYPDMYDIFNALKYTAFQDVKVVLLGQDPYHGEHQAHGLCFSVKKGIGSRQNCPSRNRRRKSVWNTFISRQTKTTSTSRIKREQRRKAA